MSESDAIREEILKEVGQPFGSGEPQWAPDPVNVPMIRHWVDALADFNPIYLDDAAARAAGHPGIVAPPAMLQTWGMQRPLIEGIAERGGTAQPVTGESAITRLAVASSQAWFVTTSVPDNNWTAKVTVPVTVGESVPRLHVTNPLV